MNIKQVIEDISGKIAPQPIEKFTPQEIKKTSDSMIGQIVCLLSKLDLDEYSDDDLRNTIKHYDTLQDDYGQKHTARDSQTYYHGMQQLAVQSYIAIAMLHGKHKIEQPVLDWYAKNYQHI